MWGSVVRVTCVFSMQPQCLRSLHLVASLYSGLSKDAKCLLFSTWLYTMYLFLSYRHFLSWQGVASFPVSHVGSLTYKIGRAWKQGCSWLKPSGAWTWMNPNLGHVASSCAYATAQYCKMHNYTQGSKWCACVTHFGFSLGTRLCEWPELTVDRLSV